MDAQNLIDNFSTHMKNVIARAISFTSGIHAPQVEPIHLLYALSQEEGSVGYEILQKFDITKDLISHALPIPDTLVPEHTSLGTFPELSLLSRKVLEKALIIAHERGHSYIGTEHLLFGLLHIDTHDTNKGLQKLSIDFKLVQEQIEVAFQNVARFSHITDIQDMLEQTNEHMENMPLPQMPPGIQLFTGKKTKKLTALAQFTNDLTSKQSQVRLDPVIGREQEIERMINILARRNKNNPILVGEPGVGKTAIVEGLAKRIAEGTVPPILYHKKILSLDLTLIVAGTIYRGEFEARLKQIIDECAANPNYILFIDELHNIIGAGSNQGTMDAANILKPALARGQLRCIGATTYDEYKKYISSDPALERRFQMIEIDEPNEAQTLEIILGVKKYYEKFHGVTITPKAIETALQLSSRYIHDNYQPDKTIDIIDEACGLVRSKQKLTTYDKDLITLEHEIETLRQHKEEAIVKEQLRVALNLKKKLDKLQKKYDKLKKSHKDNPLSKPRITEQHIRHVVSTKLHIDETLLYQDEWQQLALLDSGLKKTIIGQDHVIDNIISALERAHLGLKNTKRPFASFLFVGPSGVGKTELAKQLAKNLYHDDMALITLNMSEFGEGHSVSKLLGSPAGYIGYKDRNPFIEKLKRRPYSVLLFDEIDKAHPDVLKLLLQILDEGVITENNGKTISLKHATVILTSNIGAELFKSHSIGFGGKAHKPEIKNSDLEKHIHSKLKEEIGAAVLGRLDSVCIFNLLTEDDVSRIASNYIDSINQELTQKKNITLKADPTALKHIVIESKHDDTGARTVERNIECLMQRLCIEILRKKIKKNVYTFTHENGSYRLL